MRVYRYRGETSFDSWVEDETSEGSYWEALMKDAEGKEEARNANVPAEHQQA